MRQIVIHFILFITLFINKVSAQIYTVGTPVNQTISSDTYFSNGTCYPSSPDVSISFPYSTITGVNNLLIVTDLTSQNPVYTLSGDTVHLGDTLLFVQDQYIYKFYSDSSWQISFIVKAVGTPLIPDQSYNCGEGFWFDLLTDCDNSLIFQFDNNLCNVSDSIGIYTSEAKPIKNVFSSNTSSIDENNDNRIQIFLNPENNLLTINTINQLPLKGIQIIDPTAREETIHISPGNTTFDLSGYPNGIYFIEVTFENDLIRKKIVKVK